jgi:tRNA(Arg) A34 adenosine deaminase TadA
VGFIKSPYTGVMKELKPALTPHTLMQRALVLAGQANTAGEVPIGAVLADAEGHILAEAANAVEADLNPLAHAEMRTLQAAIATGRRYFEDCTLAVTLEPCAMCMAALCHARVGRVVFGAYDVKSGGTTHGARVPQHMHFKPEVLGGIEEEASKALLQEFFKGLRM